ncbi:Fc.00g042230.m01.CDS01 [Cosmosporella sp. VM-42]
MHLLAADETQERGERRGYGVANLDFEARVPVPFSIFPSTYRDSDSQTQTQQTTTTEEVEIKLPQKQPAGREGQYSSYSATTELPPRGEQRYSEEEVRITREEERYRRPGFKQEQHYHIHEESRPEPPSEYTTSHAHVEVDTRRHPYYSTPVDIAEREYRERFRPNNNFTVDPPSRPQYQTNDTFQVNNYTVEGRPSAPQYHTTEKTEINNFTVDGRSSRPQYQTTEKTEINNFTVDGRSSRPQYHTTEKTEINNFTVDASSSRPQYNATETTQVNNFTVDAPASRPYYKKDVKITEETVEPAKFGHSSKKDKMGYYDDDGHYHSFRAGAHKLADKIVHPRGGHEHIDVDIHTSGPRQRSGPELDLPNTVTIPCHHIRLGDFLMLQGRPCQVIRISTSSATGQYRYLGVDLFTKQLHEESSFISNPAPSVVVQTMLGPVFKQYRVLDMQDGYLVAMTETGDVKQGLAVIDQSNLYSRLNTAFESGRGSLRVLVLNDGGRELAVDMKVLHGSRL